MQTASHLFIGNAVQLWSYEKETFSQLDWQWNTPQYSLV
jgi:hypothetical protein